MSTITIDLNVAAYDFDREPLKVGTSVATVGDVLRKLFLATSSPNSVETIMRYMGWCATLEAGSPLELTAADYEAIQKLVLDSQFNLQYKAPVILAMKAAKDAAEKELSTKAD